VDLLSFAMLTWVLAPLNIKAKLISHFLTDPSGKYMIGSYLGNNLPKGSGCCDGSPCARQAASSEEP
jgi:hypothetical protein